MIDDLKAMAIFAETVKRGSFRAAAKALNLSPSVVSYQVSKLEERLGTTLLYRSTRKLSMTTEGETLLNHATQMIDQAQLGIRNVSGHDVATGRLTITLPHSVTGDIITKKIAEFSKQNPGIEMRFIYSDMRRDLISEGIDIAFSMGKLHDSSFNSKKLSDKGRILVCSPDYYKKYPKPKHPDDLLNWDWIQHLSLAGGRTFIKGKDKRTLDLNGNICANSAEAMFQFALLGLGLCTVGEWLLTDEIDNGSLIHVLPDWKVEPLPFYAVWHSNITNCSNTRRLLNFLQQN